uniref:Putative structural protein n=1 Tax=viral metagenome TaxID=1070528 RepID=A0A6M3J7Y6_9ZZZZ
MTIDADISIDLINKRIYQVDDYVAGTDTCYSVQALYTYLMDTFDAQAYMDDTIPMSAQTPNAVTMINGWFIDDKTIEWFKDGTIESSGWTHPTNPTGIRLLQLDAAAGLTAADIGKAVAGVTTTDTGTLLAYNVTRKVLWVRCDAADDLFDNGTEAITVDAVACGNMTAVSTTGENLYVNVYTLGTLTSASDTIYVLQNDTKLPAWWAAGITAFDVLIKVKELGATIDSGNIIVFTRYYPTAGNAALYDHFPITLTGGRQAVPLATALDLNNTSSQATASGWFGAMTFGYAGPYSRDLNNGSGAKNYDVEIDLNGDTVAHLYEACKYVCREGSTTQVDGDNGEEYISAEPTTYVAVKQSPFGTFAGGKFFGARGVWITNYAAADAQNFQLIASDNTTQTPPNTVTCQVVSVVANDSVAMFALTGSGGDIEKTTYTLSGQHLSTATTVTVVEAITGNWPASATTQSPPQAGYLRIVSATDGSEILATYTSWTGSVFTLVGTLGTQAEDTWKVYVPIIDKAVPSGTSILNTLIQSETVYVRTVVRHYEAPPNAIIPWSQDSSIGATGITVNATRTPDGIVT